MYKWGKRSLRRRAELHPDLQAIADDALLEMNVTILCGHRGESKQTAAFNAKKSKLRFPLSKHNRLPSRAMDIAPYPVKWDDINRFIEMGVLIERIAERRGIKIVWGGRWKSLKDYPHVELEG